MLSDKPPNILNKCAMHAWSFGRNAFLDSISALGVRVFYTVWKPFSAGATSSLESPVADLSWPCSPETPDQVLRPGRTARRTHVVGFRGCGIPVCTCSREVKHSLTISADTTSEPFSSCRYGLTSSICSSNGSERRWNRKRKQCKSTTAAHLLLRPNHPDEVVLDVEAGHAGRVLRLGQVLPAAADQDGLELRVDRDLLEDGVLEVLVDPAAAGCFVVSEALFGIAGCSVRNHTAGGGKTFLIPRRVPFVSAARLGTLVLWP